jgi:uncharacterized protein YybS (DUF2232 family)
MKVSFRESAFPQMLLSIFLFLFSAAFIPVAGAVFLFFLPLVVFYHAALHGTAKTSLALAIAFACLLFAALSFRIAVPAIAIFTLSLSGLMLSTLAMRNASVEKAVIYPSVFLVAATAIFFIYSAYVNSVAPWDFVKKYVTVIVQENIKLYSQLPLQPEDIRLVADNEKNIIEILTRVFPSIVVIFSAFIIWANVLWGKNLLSKRGVVWTRLKSLCRWRAPEGLIWIFIFSGGFIFMRQPVLNFLGVNVFGVVCFVYFLQGLAIFSYLFQAKNVPWFLRYFFYFFIAVQQFLVIPVGALGLFDTWFDFRRYFHKKHTDD